MGDSIVKLANYYANGFESMTIRNGIEMIKEFDESVLTNLTFDLQENGD